MCTLRIHGRRQVCRRYLSPVWSDLLEVQQVRFYHNRSKAARYLPGVRREVRFYQCYLLYAGLRRPRAYGYASLGVMEMVGKGIMKIRKTHF